MLIHVSLLLHTLSEMSHWYTYEYVLICFRSRVVRRRPRISIDCLLR